MGFDSPRLLSRWFFVLYISCGRYNPYRIWPYYKAHCTYCKTLFSRNWRRISYNICRKHGSRIQYVRFFPALYNSTYHSADTFTYRIYHIFKTKKTSWAYLFYAYAFRRNRKSCKQTYARLCGGFFWFPSYKFCNLQYRRRIYCYRRVPVYTVHTFIILQERLKIWK